MYNYLYVRYIEEQKKRSANIILSYLKSKYQEYMNIKMCNCCFGVIKKKKEGYSACLDITTKVYTLKFESHKIFLGLFAKE